VKCTEDLSGGNYWVHPKQGFLESVGIFNENFTYSWKVPRRPWIGI